VSQRIPFRVDFYVSQQVTAEIRSLSLCFPEGEDVLHLVISDAPETGSVEVSPNIMAELDDQAQ